jgi:phenylalanyl-tRNA synthetase beta subunit
LKPTSPGTAKSVGYNNTPITLPVDMGARLARGERRERVNEVLAGEGFYEIFTTVLAAASSATARRR